MHEHLLTRYNLPYSGLAFIFALLPTKSQVASVLSQIAAGGSGAAVQWALVAGFTALPVMVLALPIYRAVRRSLEDGDRRGAIAIICAATFLIAYCGLRLLFWIS